MAKQRSEKVEKAEERGERLRQEEIAEELEKPEGTGAYVRVRLLRSFSGFGAVGDIVPVGRERADRWAREGLASLSLKPAEGDKPTTERDEK